MSLLVDGAASAIAGNTTCRVYTRGRCKNYTVDALASRFRADSITRDVDGSPVWSAAAPAVVADMVAFDPELGRSRLRVATSLSEGLPEGWPSRYM